MKRESAHKHNKTPNTFLDSWGGEKWYVCPKCGWASVIGDFVYQEGDEEPICARCDANESGQN